MKISQNQIINIAFSSFILIMVYMYYIETLVTKFDYILAIIAILLSHIILFSKNNNIIDIGHFLYCFVYLFSVAFLSDNLYLLGLNIIMITNIILSRYYYGLCIISSIHNDCGFFMDINRFIKKIFSIWNWDYMFPIILVVSLIRFIKLFRLQ